MSKSGWFYELGALRRNGVHSGFDRGFCGWFLCGESCAGCARCLFVTVWRFCETLVFLPSLFSFFLFSGITLGGFEKVWRFFRARSVFFSRDLTLGGLAKRSFFFRNFFGIFCLRERSFRQNFEGCFRQWFISLRMAVQRRDLASNTRRYSLDFVRQVIRETQLPRDRRVTDDDISMYKKVSAECFLWLPDLYFLLLFFS